MIRLLQSLNAVLSNMLSISVSCLGLQFSSGVLNAVALANMSCMLVTFPTSHEPTSSLKLLALNIAIIFTTFPTFHELRFWLSLLADANMCHMLRTLLTSHEPRSRLKFVAPSNIRAMLLTLATFQALIFPLNMVA